ncbi:S1 family peptidase [Nocardia tengchongensis]|uniref:S1 family peptidase n=1 Tax=Nocardia tengchongensis TaxID=2055889 RepID=UPI0036BBB116
MYSTDRTKFRLSAKPAGVMVAATVCVAASTAVASAIEGGAPVMRGEQPWYTGIVMTGEASTVGRLVCGGTLIAADRVLTAGHCVEGAAPADLAVRFDADVLDGAGREVPIRRIATHPGYEIANSAEGIRRVHNDVAVIELAEPVAGPVLPMAVAAPGAGTQVTGFGHGNTGAQADKSNALLQAAFTVLSAAACDASMQGNYLFEGDQQLCVGPPEPSAVKPCSGDSGGPLVAGAGGEARLVGVASYLDRPTACDDPTSRLAAYADVADFRDWALSPNPVWAPRPLGDVILEGNQRISGTVTCRAPEWDGHPNTVEYQWLVSGVDDAGRAVDIPISGAADQPWFTIPENAAGHTAGCLVTARNEGGTATAATAIHLNPSA